MTISGDETTMAMEILPFLLLLLLAKTPPTMTIGGRSDDGRFFAAAVVDDVSAAFAEAVVVSLTFVVSSSVSALISTTTGTTKTTLAKSTTTTSSMLTLPNRPNDDGDVDPTKVELTWFSWGLCPAFFFRSYCCCCRCCCSQPRTVGSVICISTRREVGEVLLGLLLVYTSKVQWHYGENIFPSSNTNITNRSYRHRHGKQTC